MNQRILSGTLGFVSAVGAAILVATPGSLGLPDTAVAWVGILMAGCAFLQMFMGPVHKA